MLLPFRLMKVTGLAIVPPPEAADMPRVTPELLASVLARYSRSNEGLGAILEKVDLANPDASIDRILRFVDYGHASIGGLTGGIAMAVDDVSMWLAYKLFEIAQMADGQESSTRYIAMRDDNLPAPEEIGLDEDLVPGWRRLMEDAFAAYNEEFARLDAIAEENPEMIRCPEGAKPAVIKRIRKNFALDRARYFVPFATRTNLALVMTSRMWAETVKHLASLPQVEAQTAAGLLREQLKRLSPRLMRHSEAEESFVRQAAADLDNSFTAGLSALSMERLPDEVWVRTDSEAPPFLPETQSVSDALRHRANRYGRVGRALRRMRVTFAWNNIAVAELRDLNRHRTGNRFTPLIQNGFYLPPEIDAAKYRPFLERQTALLKQMLERRSAGYTYALLLGSQTPFEHSTQADKFLYEAELRTGMGAHFRYAEHLSGALSRFYETVPEARDWVEEGAAEPE